jgi:hypothetical protein
VGFIAALSLQLRCTFASPFYLSMLSSPSGRIAGSRPLSCALAPASLWTQLLWGCRWPLRSCSGDVELDFF